MVEGCCPHPHNGPFPCEARRLSALAPRSTDLKRVETSFGATPFDFNVGDAGPARSGLEELQELRQSRSGPFHHHFHGVSIIQVPGPTYQPQVLGLAPGVAAEGYALYASHYQNAEPCDVLEMFSRHCTDQITRGIHNGLSEDPQRGPCSNVIISSHPLSAGSLRTYVPLPPKQTEAGQRFIYFGRLTCYLTHRRVLARTDGTRKRT